MLHSLAESQPPNTELQRPKLVEPQGIPMNKHIEIYRHPLSGHSHRVQLFASLAGINYELIDVDLVAGEHKKAPFLSLNPFGQVPVIKDGELIVSDSNAILVYLARKYAPQWLPTELSLEAEVQRFLSIAAGPIAFGPALARMAAIFKMPLDIEAATKTAHRLFTALEKHVENREWLVGSSPTIADVAIYSYTAHAPEGNISLDSYVRLQGLLTRIESLPGFVPMKTTKT
ncbi:MAG: glutathione S-transferase [Myxococcales bacterium]|nr:glutathione S-transferase [Myxococcales bacterium]